MPRGTNPDRELKTLGALRTTRRRLIVAALGILIALAALLVLASATALVLTAFFSTVALPAVLAAAIVAAGPIVPFIALGVGLAVLIGAAVSTWFYRRALAKVDAVKVLKVLSENPQLDVLDRAAIEGTGSAPSASAPSANLLASPAGGAAPQPLMREDSDSGGLLMVVDPSTLLASAAGGAAPQPLMREDSDSGGLLMVVDPSTGKVVGGMKELMRLSPDALNGDGRSNAYLRGDHGHYDGDVYDPPPVRRRSVSNGPASGSVAGGGAETGHRDGTPMRIDLSVGTDTGTGTRDAAETSHSRRPAAGAPGDDEA